MVGCEQPKWPHASVSDIDFTIPALKGIRMISEGISHRSSSASCSSSHFTTPKPTDAELLNYQKLSKTGKPVLLFFVPDFCNAYIPRCEKGIRILHSL